MYWNANDIKNKLIEVKHMALTDSIDITIFQETHMQVKRNMDTARIMYKLVVLAELVNMEAIAISIGIGRDSINI